MRNPPLVDPLPPESSSGDEDPERLLEGRGRRVRIVRRANLDEGLDQALRGAVAVQLGGLSEEVTQALVDVARAAFQRHLEEHSRAGRELREGELEGILRQARAHFERSGAEMRDRIQSLEGDLSRQLGAIRRAEEDLAEETRLLEDPRHHPLALRIRELFHGSGIEAEGLHELQEAVVAVVLAKLKEQHQQLVLLQQAENQRQLELAQRRIAKLTANLEKVEAHLQRLQRMKSVDPGLASIYREIQGLSEEDAFADLKRQMLEKIFEANLELKARIDSGEDQN